MNFKLLTSAFLLLSILTLSSCNKDKESPVIQIDTPVINTIYPGDTTMQISVEFTDDQELARYEYYVGDILLQHSTDFVWEEAGIITGKSFTMISSRQVPTGLNDIYYMIFKVTDEAGKETVESTPFMVTP